MPREQITHNELRIPVADALTNGTRDDAPDANGRNVHVGWNANGGWVQLSVEVGSEDLVALATPSEDVSHGPSRHIWSEVLTRRDVNKLIQTLRSARDKAYGRDE